MREPQSINAKLFLPIILIGIVGYAFTLLWDNLCRNKKLVFDWPRRRPTNKKENVKSDLIANQNRQYLH